MNILNWIKDSPFAWVPVLLLAVVVIRLLNQKVVRPLLPQRRGGFGAFGDRGLSSGS